MKKMLEKFSHSMLSRDQMRSYQGGLMAEAVADCSANVSIKCSGGTYCTQTSGSSGSCECKDNGGNVVDSKICAIG